MKSRKAIAVALVGMLAQPALTIASGDQHVTNRFDSWPDRPIKHLVVIFGENISFDHYFGTYPNALNPSGEPSFHAASGTPTVNGLKGSLLTNNPNLNAANGAGATNPFRLSRSQAWTASQNHDYMPEQAAYDKGLMDLFPAKTGTADNAKMLPTGLTATTGLTMGYYDGNTVTGLWNYAQHFAMSDNSYSTGFGPSTVGALNLISGQTNGVQAINFAGAALSGADIVDGNNGYYSVIEDPSPLDDVCSTQTDINGGVVRLTGQNIGDLLDAKNVTYGGFAGGFDLTRVNADGNTGCSRDTQNSLHPNKGVFDFVPHHAFFNYWATTANDTHRRPSCLTQTTPDYSCIGKTSDTAVHNYDIEDFFNSVNAGSYPAVSFLKSIKIEDGHGGNSDPLNEQAFVVRVVNFLQQRSDWKDTAVVVLYDDSDGWYDHQAGPLLAASHTAQDFLNGAGACTSDPSTLFPTPATPVTTPSGINDKPADGRCGPGPRQPLQVISPWAKKGFVDHSVTNQAAVIRFVEDNWLGGQRIGHGSWDSISLDGKPVTDKTENSIYNLFDFSGATPGNATPFLLNCNGTPATTAPANSAAGKNDACAAWFDKT